MTITWVGHATVLIEVGGVRLITDPAVTKRLMHLVRRGPVPLIDPVDAVLISHLHMDHLHLPSLRRLGPVPELVVPAGAAPLVRGLHPSRLVEVSAGDVHRLNAAGGVVEVCAVEAEHSDRRGPHSRTTARAIGYVIRHAGRSVYFAGDTDLFDGMADIGPVDVALLPIWGWGPTVGERHLTPPTAALAVERLRAAAVIPIHWGTYSPTTLRRGEPAWLGDPLDRFRGELDLLGLGERLVALRPGDAWALPAAG